MERGTEIFAGKSKIINSEFGESVEEKFAVILLYNGEPVSIEGFNSYEEMMKCETISDCLEPNLITYL